jgi:hypothetical protein
MRGRAKIAAASAAALAAVAIGACGGDGGGSDEEQVTDVVEEFVQAGNEGDATAACDLLAAEQAERIGRLGEGDCEEALGGFLEAAGDSETEVEVEEVRVDESRATADVTITQDGARRDESLLLVEEEGEWRLASAGL